MNLDDHIKMLNKVKNAGDGSNGKKKLVFDTLYRCDLKVLAVYPKKDRVIVDVGTDEDDAERKRLIDAK